jgi:hypothetical protein
MTRSKTFEPASLATVIELTSADIRPAELLYEPHANEDVIESVVEQRERPSFKAGKQALRHPESLSQDGHCHDDMQRLRRRSPSHVPHPMAHRTGPRARPAAVPDDRSWRARLLRPLPTPQAPSEWRRASLPADADKAPVGG